MTFSETNYDNKDNENYIEELKDNNEDFKNLNDEVAEITTIFQNFTRANRTARSCSGGTCRATASAPAC